MSDQFVFVVFRTRMEKMIDQLKTKLQETRYAKMKTY